jgi:hypothetical protein
MPVTTFGANEICAEVLSNTMYLALLTALPSNSDTGSTLVEPAAADYDRYTLDHSYWGTPAGGLSTFNIDITMLPVNNWGLIVAYALCTAATAGQIRAYEYFAAGMDVRSGSRLVILSGQLSYAVL